MRSIATATHAQVTYGATSASASATAIVIRSSAHIPPPPSLFTSVPWCRHINLRLASRHEQREWVESLNALKDSGSEVEVRSEVEAEELTVQPPNKRLRRLASPSMPEIIPEVTPPRAATCCWGAGTRAGSGCGVRGSWRRAGGSQCGSRTGGHSQGLNK